MPATRAGPPHPRGGRTVARSRSLRPAIPKLIYYAKQHILIVPTGGGAGRILTADIDRNILSPRWAADGKWIYAFLEDDRNQQLVRLNAASGKLERLHEGRRETTAFDVGAKQPHRAAGKYGGSAG